MLDELIPAPRGGVSFRVPASYEAVARIHHAPGGEGTSWCVGDHDLRDEPEVPVPSLALLAAPEGDLDEAVVDALVPVLRRATGSPEHVHFAQWVGWGDLHRGSQRFVQVGAGALERRRLDRLIAKREEAAEPVYSFVESCPHVEWWGGRTMFLFDGAIEAVATIGVGAPLRHDRLVRRSPQWWWPADRSWFVATVVDDPCSYVAGDAALIFEVEDLVVDVRRVDSADRW